MSDMVHNWPWDTPLMLTCSSLFVVMSTGPVCVGWVGGHPMFQDLVSEALSWDEVNKCPRFPEIMSTSWLLLHALPPK